MAIIKAVSSRASIGRAIKYVTDPEKTDELLVSGKDCSPETAIEEMQATKELWEKAGGREYLHVVQSFDDDITPQEAHEIGLNLAERSFPGHEVLIATHTDTGHIHNHLIVNSVNHETGLKLHMSKQDLQSIKDISDTLVQERGLSITPKGQEITSFKQPKYRAIERGINTQYKSYLFECRNAVAEVSKSAINRTDFIEKMEERGYKTTWSDERKYITFEDKEGNKIRNSNLEKTFKKPYGKEELEHEFTRNVANARSNQRFDIEKQRADISKQRADISKQRADIEKQRADIDKQRNEVAEQRFRNVNQRAEPVHGKPDHREQQFKGRDIEEGFDDLTGKSRDAEIESRNKIRRDEGLKRDQTGRDKQELDHPITRGRGKGKDFGR
jgi:hypothetical protein